MTKLKTVGPVQCERHDRNDGEIVYEIWDYNKDTYHRICVLSESGSDCALSDAKLIVKAINGFAKLREALSWFLSDERFQVGVGGNPIVVERMIAEARKILEATK